MTTSRPDQGHEAFIGLGDRVEVGGLGQLHGSRGHLLRLDPGQVANLLGDQAKEFPRLPVL